MKRQDGFTLLSAMLALGIFATALFLIVSIIGVVANRFQDQGGSSLKETSLFFSQTASELHLSDEVATSENHEQLFLKKGAAEITYKNDRQRIVRLVGGQGYEIVLQHVKDVHFYSDGTFLAIQIVDSSNRSHYWMDRLYMSGEE